MSDDEQHLYSDQEQDQVDDQQSGMDESGADQDESGEQEGSGDENEQGSGDENENDEGGQESGSGSESEQDQEDADNPPSESEGGGETSDGKGSSKKKKEKKNKRKDSSLSDLHRLAQGDFKRRVSKDVKYALKFIRDAFLHSVHRSVSDFVRSFSSDKHVISIRSSVMRQRKKKENDESSSKKKKKKDKKQQSEKFRPSTVISAIKLLFSNLKITKEVQDVIIIGALEAGKKYAESLKSKDREKGERIYQHLGYHINPKIARHALTILNKDNKFYRIDARAVYELIGATETILRKIVHFADDVIRVSRPVGRSIDIHNEVNDKLVNSATLYAYHIQQAVDFVAPFMKSLMGVIPNVKPHGRRYVEDIDLKLAHMTVDVAKTIAKHDNDVAGVLFEGVGAEEIEEKQRKRRASAEKRKNSLKKTSSSKKSKDKKNKKKKKTTTPKSVKKDKGSGSVAKSKKSAKSATKSSKSPAKSTGSSKKNVSGTKSKGKSSTKVTPRRSPRHKS